jgi:hypothetical protein
MVCSIYEGLITLEMGSIYEGLITLEMGSIYEGLITLEMGAANAGRQSLRGNSIMSVALTNSKN